jgi:hypothetical protein
MPDTRVIKFNIYSEGVMPYSVDEIVGTLDLKRINGECYFNEDTYELFVLSNVMQVQDNTDLFITEQGKVFSVGSDEHSVPEGFLKERV